MPSFECDTCGIAACDLPDGFDPEDAFEREDGETWCKSCYYNRPASGSLSPFGLDGIVFTDPHPFL